MIFLKNSHDYSQKNITFALGFKSHLSAQAPQQ